MGGQPGTRGLVMPGASPASRPGGCASRARRAGPGGAGQLRANAFRSGGCLAHVGLHPESCGGAGGDRFPLKESRDAECSLCSITRGAVGMGHAMSGLPCSSRRATAVSGLSVCQRWEHPQSLVTRFCYRHKISGRFAWVSLTLWFGLQREHCGLKDQIPNSCCLNWFSVSSLCLYAIFQCIQYCSAPLLSTNCCRCCRCVVLLKANPRTAQCPMCSSRCAGVAFRQH